MLDSDILDKMKEFDSLVKDIDQNYCDFEQNFSLYASMIQKQNKNHLDVIKQLNTSKTLNSSAKHAIELKQNQCFNHILKTIWSLSAINENVFIISQMKEQIYCLIEYLKESNNTTNSQVKSIFGLFINLLRTSKGKLILSTYESDINNLISYYSTIETTKEESLILMKLMK